MSLDYVRKGEAVKASTVNSIIDTIGGNQRMSPDLDVTTTARGPQVSMPSNYGGPNNRPYEILELNRYMLSGWPMMMIQLGPRIDDCLGAIRLHKADGTIATSVSAAVVFKNSELCPTGDVLSGYLLSAEDFGRDSAAHAAGWMPTMIEDIYPAGWMQAQLWKYDDGAKLATVFTNVYDALSVRSQLSALLGDGGEVSSDLSSIEKVDGWDLASSTVLSAQEHGQTIFLPTHEIVNKRGTIDVYESSSFDYKVVLKSSLVCLKVNESDPDPDTGETDVESTVWAWQIPLGPGAACSEGKASSPNVTYGGNPVVFEVEEGDVGDDYTGEATYKDGVITFGKFTAQAGEELEAGELWLNLAYDYQDKCVKGTFGEEPEDGSYTQDGLLSRSVFVISAVKFAPNVDEVYAGTKASVETLTYGTWGVLPKDGPKLDTYCPVDSEKSFKSLDWADREGEVVSCECAELHDFDQLETVDPLSTDHLVIRRVDDSEGAELKYISLSALEISGMYVPPDADVEDAQTSSLQTRELDNGSNVEEMFNFHLSDTVEVRISDLTSVDIVIRNPNDGRPYIEYGRLCVDIAPDAEGQTGQKSIDWLDGTHELQLYNMDSPGEAGNTVVITLSAKPLLPNEYEFVVRKNGAGGEIAYTRLSGLVEGHTGDANLSTHGLSSVYLSSDGQYELFDFHLSGTHYGLSALSSLEFVVRDNENKCVNYVSPDILSSVLSVHTGDSNTPSHGLSSVYLSDDGQYELFDFHIPGTHYGLTDLTSVEFVVRDNENKCVNYVSHESLSTVIPVHTGDSNGTAHGLSSIYLSSDGQYELFDFHLSDTVDVRISDLANVDIVLRNPNDGKAYVQYGRLCVDIAPDASGQSGQKSIDWLSGTNELQLYKFDEDGLSDAFEPDVTVNSNRELLLPDEYEFVLRKNGAGGEVTYGQVSLSVKMEELSGDSQVSEQKSISVINNVIELYKMGEAGQEVSSEVPTRFDEPKTILADDCEFVIRKGGAGGEIDYTTVKLRQARLSVDSDGAQKSVQYNPTTDELQLYKMHAEGEPTEEVDLKWAKNSFQSLLPDDEEFVIRTRAGGVIQYKNVGVCLSAYLSGGVVISGDNEKTPSQKSIDLVFDGDDPDYYQLHDMDKAGVQLPQKAITMSADGYTPLLPGDYEFVLRQNGAGGTIKYANLSCCIPDLSALSATIVSGDNEVVGSRKSVDFVNEPGSDPYYQLHKFQDSPVPGPDTWLKFSDQPLSGQDFSIGCQTQFVVRVPDGAGGYEVKYMQLSAYQEHERVDTYTQQPKGRSVDYASYDEGYGCYQALELYGFDWGCTSLITSADISAEYGNGILIRKWDGYGCCWYLDYMKFDSLDELAVKYVGDSQLSLSAHDPYHRSTAVWWDDDDKKKYVELYGFRSDFDSDTVTIHNDGCTYYWPQDVRNDEPLTEWDYVLVKHVDSNGNISLRYTQLEVEMPDIDVSGIQQDITNVYDEINYLSGRIDDLSGSLSSGFWESGGDSGTCYGKNIADSNQIIAIELDDHILTNDWDCDGTFYADYFDVGCSISLGNTTIGHNNIHLDGQLGFVGGCDYLADGAFYTGGTMTAGCGFYTGCAYFTPYSAYVDGTITAGCSIVIGCVSLNEAQLSALLQLIN